MFGHKVGDALAILAQPAKPRPRPEFQMGFPRVPQVEHIVRQSQTCGGVNFTSVSNKTPSNYYSASDVSPQIGAMT